MAAAVMAAATVVTVVTPATPVQPWLPRPITHRHPLPTSEVAAPTMPGLTPRRGSAPSMADPRDGVIDGVITATWAGSGSQAAPGPRRVLIVTASSAMAWVVVPEAREISLVNVFSNAPGSVRGS